ncbi:formate dehydrogenase gamma subunit [Tranquillimonas rosea]|uniref:Formate dehydrogenase gamma subunit n=1 Tax=Tranquillimonas rosea TaxID=641238 RepID=A0A1H9WB46_9RHOB|nr:formate dehydrogenase subunit gamma [Tranquillimonas rosea]SES31055.1 formate dehydrogenase gamma subunit [Tranquillimonas rosea]
MRLSALLPLLLSLLLAMPLAAQDNVRPPESAVGGGFDSGETVRPPSDSVPQGAPPAVEARPETGGAQTLEDILRRQNGEELDDSFRREATGRNDGDAPTAGQLGTLGGASDPEIWRQLRYDTAQVQASARGPAADVLIQDGGMRWLQFREGPLATYGGYLLLGVLAILALFYLIRGRIRIDGAITGRRILRFQSIERFGHWLLAGSFIVLALSGLFLLFGRLGLIELIGKDFYADIAAVAIWSHNNISWAFMLGLVLVTVMWIADNIPNKTDLKWLAVGGGIFSRNVHPPAYKFNAGQKLIFWAVVLLGASISLSGLSLLFPFEMPLFAKTFEVINGMGIPGWFGYGPLPTDLAPHEEMQLSQVWHAIVAFLFMAVILGHIYIGTVGMEGAFDAMGSGRVEEQWAKEHHGLWVEQMKRKKRGAPARGRPAHPAE